MTSVVLALGLLAILAYVVLVLTARNRISITVGRQTADDGEQVQLSTTLNSSLGAKAISQQIDKLGLAIHARLLSNNEMILSTKLTNSHAIWLKVKSKVDAGAKLSHAEAKFWNKCGTFFNESGLKPEFSRDSVLDVVKRLDVLDDAEKAA